MKNEEGRRVGEGTGARNGVGGFPVSFLRSRWGELNRHPSRFPVIKRDCPPTWISFSQVILNFREPPRFFPSLFVYPHRRLNFVRLFSRF